MKLGYQMKTQEIKFTIYKGKENYPELMETSLDKLYSEDPELGESV